MNIIEKILARSAGRDLVERGDVVVCQPDLVVQTDLPFAIDGLWKRPLQVFDPSRILLVKDHGFPAPSARDSAGFREANRFARQFNVPTSEAIGVQGISHVVIAERAIARPGQFIVCADSHTCAAGALNCIGKGTNAVEILQVITRGDIWYDVPPVVRYDFVGTPPPYVSGKDIFFQIARRFGSHANLAMEFGGTSLSKIPMSDRRTIATMCAELAAEFVVFEFDDLTHAFFKARIQESLNPVAADQGADYCDVRVIDLSEIEPALALPGAVIGHVRSFDEIEGDRRIDQAFIGSCANGKIDDLRMAAAIVTGHRVHPEVRFLVTPGSSDIYLEAVRDGTIATLVEAGATVTNPTCGACFGYHMGVLGPGDVCITSSTRNFQGRMGSKDAAIYLAAPASVAASAITGVVTDPRKFRAGVQVPR